jgi:hypothetical protein
MGVYSSILKGIKTTFEDYKKPESFKIGEAFEDFTRNVIFPEGLYDLIQRAPKYEDNKDYQKISLQPDFYFKDKLTGKEFFIECKYRSKKENDENAVLEICSEDQLKRYKEYNKKFPTYIALSFDEKPEGFAYTLKDIVKDYKTLEQYFLDTCVMILPLPFLRTNSFDLNQMYDFAISANVPLSSKKLWNYFTNEKIFSAYCIRCKKVISESAFEPLCDTCLKSWEKFENYQYPEKYCHICGKEAKTTFAKPLCRECFSKYVG